MELLLEMQSLLIFFKRDSEDEILNDINNDTTYDLGFYNSFKTIIFKLINLKKLNLNKFKIYFSKKRFLCQKL